MERHTSIGGSGGDKDRGKSKESHESKVDKNGKSNSKPSSRLRPPKTDLKSRVVDLNMNQGEPFHPPIEDVMEREILVNSAVNKEEKHVGPTRVEWHSRHPSHLLNKRSRSNQTGDNGYDIDQDMSSFFEEFSSTKGVGSPIKQRTDKLPRTSTTLTVLGHGQTPRQTLYYPKPLKKLPQEPRPNASAIPSHMTNNLHDLSSSKLYRSNSTPSDIRGNALIKSQQTIHSSDILGDLSFENRVSGDSEERGLVTSNERHQVIEVDDLKTASSILLEGDGQFEMDHSGTSVGSNQFIPKLDPILISKSISTHNQPIASQQNNPTFLPKTAPFLSRHQSISIPPRPFQPSTPTVPVPSRLGHSTNCPNSAHEFGSRLCLPQGTILPNSGIPILGRDGRAGHDIPSRDSNIHETSSTIRNFQLPPSLPSTITSNKKLRLPRAETVSPPNNPISSTNSVDHIQVDIVNRIEEVKEKSDEKLSRESSLDLDFLNDPEIEALLNEVSVEDNPSSTAPVVWQSQSQRLLRNASHSNVAVFVPQRQYNQQQATLATNINEDKSQANVSTFAPQYQPQTSMVANSNETLELAGALTVPKLNSAYQNQTSLANTNLTTIQGHSQATRPFQLPTYQPRPFVPSISQLHPSTSSIFQPRPFMFQARAPSFQPSIFQPKTIQTPDVNLSRPTGLQQLESVKKELNDDGFDFDFDSDDSVFKEHIDLPIKETVTENQTVFHQIQSDRNKNQLDERQDLSQQKILQPQHLSQQQRPIPLLVETLPSTKKRSRSPSLDLEDFDFDSDEIDLLEQPSQLAFNPATIRLVPPTNTTYPTQNNQTCTSQNSTIPPNTQTNILTPNNDVHLDQSFPQNTINHYTSNLATSQSENVSNNLNYRRLKVLEERYIYKNDNSSQELSEKVLVTLDEMLSQEVVVHLRGQWMETPTPRNTVINVVTPDQPTNRYSIDNYRGYLIIEPDLLINITHLADSFSCMRRAVLSTLVRSTLGLESKAMTFGILSHELLQASLLTDKFEPDDMDRITKKLILEHTEQLLLCDETEDTTLEHLREHYPILREWAMRYLVSHKDKIKGSEAEEISGSGMNGMMIDRVVAIEESIWSLMFGLKGKIDILIQSLLPTSSATRNLLIPLEYKTGKANLAVGHQAQLLLYMVMMSDKYATPIDHGYLFYCQGEVRSTQMFKVQLNYEHIASILRARNSLTSNMDLAPTKLPEMLDNSYICKNCHMVDACLLYNQTYKAPLPTGNKHKVKEVDSELMSKLDDVKDIHLNFFKLYDSLLMQEQKDVHESRKRIWVPNIKSTSTTNNRPSVPDSVYPMVVVEQLTSLAVKKFQTAYSQLTSSPHLTNNSRDDIEDIAISPWHYYRFKRYQPFNTSQGSVGGLLSSSLAVGEPIVLSTCGEDSKVKQHVGLGIGFVLQITDFDIVVSLDRKLVGPPRRVNRFNHSTNQAFLNTQSSDVSSNEVVTYRIDKDELTSGMLQVRNHLVELVMAKNDLTRQLRDVVIDNKEPTFTHSLAMRCPVLEHLNQDQQLAIQASLAMDDYALILGMPGTGKTTTIANIISVHFKLNRTILITSHTHTAVDNIIKKLAHMGIHSILRLGNVEKLDPEVLPYSSEMKKRMAKQTVSQLHNMYYNTQIVATTCLGVGHPLFLKRKFDLCIIDEAAQITLPVALGPLKVARKFLMVGDHYQLPPLIMNSQLRDGPLSISLFEMLANKHPEFVVKLTYQYRMNGDIMQYCNELTYSDQLKCGNQQIENRIVDYQVKDWKQAIHSISSSITTQCDINQCWLTKTIHPQTKMIFLNTDLLHSANVEYTTNNPTEVQLIFQLSSILTQSLKLSPNQLAILSPYKNQISNLNLIMSKDKILKKIAKLTIDKSQGLEYEIVIVALCRVNKLEKDGVKGIGDLLSDIRRMNVALTRARSKLILIGSKHTMSNNNSSLKPIMEILENRKAISTLPTDALDLHNPSSTQLSLP